MALSVTHTFVSAKLDDPDATFVRPSNWNAAHTLTMTTNKLLGRATAATGPVEELTLGSNLALTGTTLNLAASSVTYAQMQNVSAASKLLGRGSAAGAGNPEEITLGAGLTMTGATLAASAAAATVTRPCGRLTLQTATPVMTTTQSAKTTIYYTPYVGNQVPIYDGTNMTMTAFTELSVATSDTTKSPAAIGASKVNDWFVWNDAGTVRIGHGPDWTSDTARSAGTALVRVNGIWLNNVTITNGPAASRGTYVGTTRSNGSSQLDWILGGDAVGGTAGFFGVWNTYNRVIVSSYTRETTGSWTYATPVWRAANASNGMRTSFVCGLAEEGFSGIYSAPAASDTVAQRSAVGVGFDSTTVYSPPITGVTGDDHLQTIVATCIVPSTLGFHFLQALEWGTPSTVSTFWGVVGAVEYNGGLYFQGRM